MVETKTARYVHDIELHFTKKVKRTQTKRFLSKSKGCRVVKSTTGPWPQCINKEQAWNGNTIDLLTDHRSLRQWLYIRSIFCHMLNERQVSAVTSN